MGADSCDHHVKESWIAVWPEAQPASNFGRNCREDGFRRSLAKDEIQGRRLVQRNRLLPEVAARGAMGANTQGLASSKPGIAGNKNELRSDEAALIAMNSSRTNGHLALFGSVAPLIAIWPITTMRSLAFAIPQTAFASKLSPGWPIMNCWSSAQDTVNMVVSVHVRVSFGDRTFRTRTRTRLESRIGWPS